MTPYIGQTTILSLVTAFAFFVAWRMSEWNLFFVTPVMWVFYAVIVFIGLQYDVFWDNQKICMKASGKADTCISYDHITHVALETANVAEMASESKPFRRIAIYGHSGHSQSKINVSLRHFRHADITSLMTSVKLHRPDLELPESF